MNFYPILSSMDALRENRGMLTLIVTICGILIVFVALILLIVIISLFGKAISSAGKVGKKEGKEAAKAVSKQESAAAATAVQKVAAAAPAASASANGIPDEIIAVIAAAVASMEDGSSYVIRSVKRSREGRPAWSTAGIIENTRPF